MKREVGNCREPIFGKKCRRCFCFKMENYLEKIKNDFDEIAAFENEAIWNHNNHYHRLILGEIKPNAERIMEVGCGAGEFSRLVSARSNGVLGVDLSEKMLQKARPSPNHSPNISYLKGNYFTHTFPENHFDYIVSISTAHHFSLPGFIEKAERELKSGGKLIILDLFGEPNALTEKLSDLGGNAGKHYFEVLAQWFYKSLAGRA